MWTSLFCIFPNVSQLIWYVHMISHCFCERDWTWSFQRGAGISVYQPFVNIGTMIAAIVSNAFSTNLSKISYRAQLALLYIVPGKRIDWSSCLVNWLIHAHWFFLVWLAIFVFLIPESPRWLAVQGNYVDAEKSLRRLRGRHVTSEEIKEEISVIKKNLIAESEASKYTNWREMFEGANLVRKDYLTSQLHKLTYLFQRRTLLCAACATFHAASGINFVRTGLILSLGSYWISYSLWFVRSFNYAIFRELNCFTTFFG